MKSGLAFVAILAVFAVNCVVSADEVNCPNLMRKDECSGSDTCNWTQDNSKNTCEQLVTCGDIALDKCLDDANKKACQLTGQNCADNTNVCMLGDNNACDTASGCTKKFSSCTAVAAGFNCAQYSTKNTETSCDKSQPYCKQDPAVPATCDYASPCPASSTTACSTPCATQSVTCQINAQCAPAAPDAANCLAANGCAFTAAEGETAASCAAIAGDCTAVTTTNGCTAAQGCSIKTYNCTTDKAVVTQYCNNLGTKCTTDPAGELYCLYNLNKTCIDSTTYCQQSTPNACDNTNAQCTVAYTCTNPQDGKCSGNTTQANCDANLCMWNAANACSNITSNEQCQALNTSVDKCVTDQTPGCAYTDGGACSTKSNGGNGGNGGNDNPQPTPTSGSIVVFSCAVLALVFAF